ncbi:hypothetical protein TESG_07661 [Trichophyton tonsurans CBS 112818]|uniref:Uncharacterized protein n=1 Tax=Trichophyton tonsurans (strain CBS 112818) TaxID=647933 RepID=F2S9U9_TRIT1|nr:hypothetical protein TESG_07661 [Trichophyton tonsurans CBS 112818]
MFHWPVSNSPSSILICSSTTSSASPYRSLQKKKRKSMVWLVEQVLGRSSICVLLLRFDYFPPYTRYLMTRMGTSRTWARS